MKSRRISNDQAGRIAQQIVHKAFEAEHDALNARRTAMLGAIVAELNPPEVLAAIQSLPERARPTRWWSLTIRLERYQSLNLGAGGAEEHAVYLNGGAVDLTDLPVETQGLVLDLYAALADYRHRRQMLTDTLFHNIKAAGTTRTLMESWPEAASIIAEVCELEAEVEKPLETLLGRYLAPALPAPQSSGGDDA